MSACNALQQTLESYLAGQADEVDHLRHQRLPEADRVALQDAAADVARRIVLAGAHPVELARRPTLGDYRRLRDAAGGRLKLITLAPEVEGTMPVIEAAVSDGIRISLGHTNASEQQIDEIRSLLRS